MVVHGSLTRKNCFFIKKKQQKRIIFHNIIIFWAFGPKDSTSHRGIIKESINVQLLCETLDFWWEYGIGPSLRSPSMFNCYVKPWIFGENMAWGHPIFLNKIILLPLATSFTKSPMPGNHLFLQINKKPWISVLQSHVPSLLDAMFRPLALKLGPLNIEFYFFKMIYNVHIF